MKANLKLLYQSFKSSSGVSIDSRSIEAGNLFFALKGPNFNGNVYAAEALEKGASFVVIDDEAYYQENDERYLLVKNGLEALQKLATHHRKKIKADVIAITGSNGKTTTKELIHAVLSTTYKTQSTKGNLNNHIGVPLTLLSLEKGVKKVVIEMGANGSGDINALCSIALPSCGLITNIGKAHLEGFGSLKGVIRAKEELFDYLEASEGKVFLNMNDNHVAKIGYFIQNATTYGNNRWFDTYGNVISLDPYLKIFWEPKGAKKNTYEDLIEIQTKLVGKYNLDNILAAITIGKYFNVEPAKIKEAIETYEPNNNRSQIIQKGSNTIIMDAYNANPTSMTAALDNFEATNADKKMVILGDMLELGKHSEKEHKAIVAKLEKMKLDQIALVGTEFSKVAVGKNGHFKVFGSIEDLKNWHDQLNLDNTHVLVKGSRGISLEKIIGS